MNREQFKYVTDWQKETFKGVTARSQVAHLRDELEELDFDLEHRKPNARLEFADCFILLFGAATASGMDYDDIRNAIQEKMKINKARKWGAPKENGIINHIREEDNHHPDQSI